MESPWLGMASPVDRRLKSMKERAGGIKCLLYADGQVILASSVDKLQLILRRMNWDFEFNGMVINASKTKLMIFDRDENIIDCYITIAEEPVEQVNVFVY